MYRSNGLVGHLIVILLFHTAIVRTSLGAPKNYGPGFFNHTGCMYVHIGGGEFEMTTADEARVNETLEVKDLTFEPTKTRCVNEKSAGKVAFTFKLDKNDKINTVGISMKITPVDKYGYWEISQVNLTIVRADIDRRRTFQTKAPSMYSAADYSYSCQRLELWTVNKKKQENETKFEPSATITLHKFQLQPFGELKRVVFASSYDCSNWATIPELMGLILILLIILVTSVGAILLRSIETNDFKFTKEGLQFTQAQLESSKRQ